MKLIPKITEKIFKLLNYTPLSEILRTLEDKPKSGMVYADDEIEPSTCVVRTGRKLFFGGKVTPECLSYVKHKIFTFEIYEIYGTFELFYPNESWRSSLTTLFPERYTLKDNMIFLDLRDLNRWVRAPEECDVLKAVQKYLPNVETVKRVPKGGSTYVYKARTPTKTYYARLLPEDCSFAAEVTAHKIMLDLGVQVPRIIAFEHKEEKSGLSMMLAEEIPGVSVEESWPDNNSEEILREAGRQLALIHSIPVDGFGWIDRSSYDVLKGEKGSFLEWFDNYLADDLIYLNYYPFTDDERKQIRGYMEQARVILDVPNAVLVQGDCDVSHVFHSNGKFSGFIDFGEIRGNNRVFDLAVFSYADESPDRMAYYSLIEGYREISLLTDDDLYAVELMGLFILLRYAGKKVEELIKDAKQVDYNPLEDYWYGLLKRQIEKIIIRK